MTDSQIRKHEFANLSHLALLTDLYMDEKKAAEQSKRYLHAIEKFEKAFGNQEIEIYSAPGRSEIGGNHTDHQQGEVLAASIDLDAIAVVSKIPDDVVRIISDGYALITIDLKQLLQRREEEGTTAALIRGVLAGVKQHGYIIGGFQAYVTSDVLIGAGLSSSAAFETILGTILSGLYNDMKISAIEIAMIGQFAENVYFGKPCGLMDQMACSVGNLVHIDFQEPEQPKVTQVTFDWSKSGYSLCIVDTKGSHADLTKDYAAIPIEMKQAAECFGREYLGQVSREEILSNLNRIRETAGDRAALRALHFIEENNRVRQEVAALEADDFPRFLCTVKASGDSSFKYLQNVYTSHDIQHQNVSIALAVSDTLLGVNGVSRVHGGGFAGTIQAFVKNEAVADYKNGMEHIFGEGSCHILNIRKYGGQKVL
ncbi:MAG: hypothetical protein NC089_05935 [Bacteroides sp.]|nr:hypothetical protein [Bacteroides sp.]MCM1548953.1 galactokinase [Clostridium sp.]